MVEMVIIFKMVIMVEMVKMVEMVILVVMAMVIRLSMLIIVTKVSNSCDVFEIYKEENSQLSQAICLPTPNKTYISCNFYFWRSRTAQW